MKIALIIISLLFFSACSYDIPLFYKTAKKTKKPIIIKQNIKEIYIKDIKEIKKPIIKKPAKTIQKEVIKTPIKSHFKFRKIAFIGDSHIASDYMSQFFRKVLNIQSLGFIPPILPKWHNQYLANYHNQGFKTEYLINTKSNLSFGGINANCIDKTCNAQIDLKFNAKNLEYLEYKNDAWQLKKYANNISKIRLSVDNAMLGGFISNNDEYIDNLGINGASIFNYHRINDELNTMMAKKLKYDLIILSFGTNESVANYVNKSNFKQKYKEIIQAFKTANSKIILLTPPEPTIYINKSYQKGTSNELVKKLILQLAKELECEVFDIDLLMSKEGGKQAWIDDKKSLKNTHLSKKGYDYVALKLLEFIKELNER